MLKNLNFDKAMLTFYSLVGYYYIKKQIVVDALKNIIYIMNHYNDFIKKRAQNTIKNNKEQFLHELWMPNTKSQKMEANIIREIKHFINTTKKNENMENNGQNDASLINAYFGLWLN